MKAFNQLGQKEKMAVAVIGVFLFLYVLNGYFYRPRMRQLEVARKEITSKRQEIERLRALPRTVAAAEARVVQMQSQITAMQQRVPAQFVPAAMIATLAGVIDQSGVELVSIAMPTSGQPPGAAPAPTGPAAIPGRPAPAAPIPSGVNYLEWPIALELRGTFPQVIGLLRAIEGLSQVVVVESVGMAPIAPPRLNVSLRMKTFTLR